MEEINEHTVSSANYTEENIRHLSDMEHVRTRPGMYIGRLGDGSQAEDGIYVLLKEVVDNSIDEFKMGAGKRIEIQLEDNLRVSVRDYGRGIPLGSLVDAVSMLNTGGKYDTKAFKKSVGLNGVGAKAVNALSSRFVAWSARDGQMRKAVFERGELISDETCATDEENGTYIFFEPDDTLFLNYRFRPEFIIDQGYMNNTYRVPSKEFQDFQAFQRREVAKLAKEMVDITHACGKEAMMFLGDHWIGMEPFMEEFQTIGLDAVVGSVGNGATLRLISDIEGVRYTEGRFLPYFFPDTFHEGGDPTREAKVNWVTARRAILRKPIDRIGYGGYLKLATQFPDFIDYVESVCKEFRELYENIKGTTPYCVKRVAILNCWGKMRAWGNHMVHHAIYYKQNYSYAGIIEALSGAPFDVKFISFDDIRNHPDLLDSFDVVLNVGDAYTAYTGGDNWKDEAILTAVRRFVYRGGGFIGVGEPASCQWQGHFFQLADILGVEEETGYTLNVDKYNWQDHAHFITEDSGDAIDFGEGKKNIFALESATVLRQIDKGVQLAVNTFGQGRGVYISGLPYSFANSRLLYRAILWAASAEGKIHRWFSTNYNVEVHAYVKNGKYCVVNNTYEPQQTTVYRGDGSSFAVDLAANAILWYEI